MNETIYTPFLDYCTDGFHFRDYEPRGFKLLESSSKNVS